MPWCTPPESITFKPGEPIKWLPWLIERSEKVTGLSERKTRVPPFRVKVAVGMADSISIRSLYRQRTGFISGHGKDFIVDNC